MERPGGEAWGKMRGEITQGEISDRVCIREVHTISLIKIGS